MQTIKDLFDLSKQLKDAELLFNSLKMDLESTYSQWKGAKIQLQSHYAMTEHDAWLFERSLGIGGSDIGALLGFSPYNTPYQLWQDKCLGINDFQGNNFTKWGNLLESVVAQNFAESFGVKILQSPPSFAGFINRATWLRANIDFDIPNSVCMGEVKTASGESKQNWGVGIEPSDVTFENIGGNVVICNTDESLSFIETIQDCEFPLAYFCQMQYYMMLKSKAYCFLTVLIGGNDERHYLIRANKDFQDLIYYRATYFMFHNVIGNQEPLKTPWEQMLDFIAFDHSGEVNVLDNDGLKETLINLNKLNEKYSEIGKVKKSMEQEIKMIIGEQTSIVDSGDTLATWNTQERIGIDKELLEDLHPEIFEEVKTETKLRVLRLSKKFLKQEEE